jgi:hypothetical protein
MSVRPKGLCIVSGIAHEWGTQEAISRLARDNKGLGVTPTERSAEIERRCSILETPASPSGISCPPG